MFFLIKDYPSNQRIYKLGNLGINIYFAYFPIYGEMASWGDSGSQTGSRTALSSGFMCGFNIVGRFMIRARQ